jgi:hypothetical protein
LLLLLLVLLLLDKGLARGEAVCGRVEAHVNLIVCHCEVGQVHLDHVVAEAALLGQLAELVLALFLDNLYLLLHLLQSQVQLPIELV